MASFKEDLSNYVLNLFLLVIHVATNSDTAINYFLPYLKQKLINFYIMFFSSLSGRLCIE